MQSTTRTRLRNPLPRFIDLIRTVHQDWDLIRLEEQAAVQAVHHSRLLPAPTPLLPAPLPVPPPALPPPPPVAVTEFYVDSGYPGYPGAHTVPTYTSHHLPSYPGVEQGGGYPSHHPHPAYQQAVHHPSFPYSPFPADPSKRHTVRSPVRWRPSLRTAALFTDHILFWSARESSAFQLVSARGFDMNPPPSPVHSQLFVL